METVMISLSSLSLWVYLYPIFFPISLLEAWKVMELCQRAEDALLTHGKNARMAVERCHERLLQFCSTSETRNTLIHFWNIFFRYISRSLRWGFVFSLIANRTVTFLIQNSYSYKKYVCAYLAVNLIHVHSLWVKFMTVPGTS